MNTTKAGMNANDWKLVVLRDMAESIDAWMHRAIVLGMLAVESGADESIVDYIIHSSKQEIDAKLLERLTR